MSVTLNASTSAGFIQTADTSGTIELQNNGTTRLTVNSGGVTIPTAVVTTLSDGTNSTSATNCIQGSAKAWVNFNGTGTVAIRASYNVSSITDNGTGDFTINFTNAMVDANYSIVIAKTNTSPGSNYIHTALYPAALSSSSARLFFVTDIDGVADPSIVCAAVFR